jgi:hypothetical protein
VKKRVLVKYRRFTGRQCAPNTGKVVEIAKEKVRAPNRRITGAKNRKTGQLTGRVLTSGCKAAGSWAAY